MTLPMHQDAAASTEKKQTSLVINQQMALSMKQKDAKDIARRYGSFGTTTARKRTHTKRSAFSQLFSDRMMDKSSYKVQGSAVSNKRKSSSTSKRLEELNPVNTLKTKTIDRVSKAEVTTSNSTMSSAESMHQNSNVHTSSAKVVSCSEKDDFDFVKQIQLEWSCDDNTQSYSKVPSLSDIPSFRASATRTVSACSDEGRFGLIRGMSSRIQKVEGNKETEDSPLCIKSDSMSLRRNSLLPMGSFHEYPNTCCSTFTISADEHKINVTPPSNDDVLFESSIIGESIMNSACDIDNLLKEEEESRDNYLSILVKYDEEPFPLEDDQEVLLEEYCHRSDYYYN